MKGKKGFQKGHGLFKGSEKGWFKKGQKFGKRRHIKKGHPSYAPGSPRSLKHSERMKLNNPMRRPDVVLKVSIANRGRKPWNWSGLEPNEIRKMRNSWQSSQWRIKIFKRDSFQCQMPGCSGTEKYLEAHHIKTFASFPEGRLNIINGITLCKKCHNKTRMKEKKFEIMFKQILTMKYGY